MRRAALALLLVAGIAHADRVTQTARPKASFDPNTVYKITRGEAPSEGRADAPITIVDWSDYACGYCNRVQDTLDRPGRLYPGQIRMVHRILPLDDDNTIAAEAALAAAAQGQFRALPARMYGVRGHIDRAGVELIAQELGLDMVRFRADLDSGSYRKAIASDVADAAQLGVTGTPTFFVNGRPVHGNQPLKVFADIVDQEHVRATGVRAQHPADLYAALVADGKPTADAPADANNENAELDPNTAYRVGLGLPGHQLGPDDALVTIVEFSDFQCPYCAKEAPVLEKLHQKYPMQTRIIYRHMAMSFHRNSSIAAEAAVAAAEQGKFWAFHDQVFSHFGHLTRDEAALEKIVDAVLGHAQDAVSRGLSARDLYGMVMSMASGEERADPASVPDASASIGGHFEMRADERARSVSAACRRHDRGRAEKLAGTLEGDARERASEVCSGEGIDLP